MFETKIVDLIGQILDTEVNEEILYYMKLEAFWILTNLCITDSYECYQLLVGDLSLEVYDEIGYTLSESIISLIDKNLN